MNTRHVGSLDQFHHRRLQSLETIARGGSLIATSAALAYCHKYGLTLPSWFVGPAAQITMESLRKEKRGKLGRSAGPLDRYCQDMVDFARYDAACEVREKQKEIPRELERLRHLSNVAASIVEDTKKMLIWVGQTWEKAFQCASMILAETSAFGGPDAVKTSYFKVKEAMRIPEQAHRYYILDPQFLAGLGMKPFQLSGRVRKVTPLFDLTLHR
jgi:hypothetical protein